MRCYILYIEHKQMPIIPFNRLFTHKHFDINLLEKIKRGEEKTADETNRQLKKFYKIVDNSCSNFQ